MAEFSVSRHGYAKEEVDSYIKKIQAEYEMSLGNQKDRVFELVEKVRELEAQLAEYKLKDEEISTALLSAVKKAKEIEKEAEERYEHELIRLKAFHSKWVRYYNEIKQKYPMDDDLMSVEKFLLEMNAILGSDVDIVETQENDKEYIRKRQEFLNNYQSEKNRVEKSSILPNNVFKNSENDSSRNSSEKRFMSLISNYDTLATTDKPNMQILKPMEKIGSYIANTVSNRPQVSDNGFDLSEVLQPSGKLDLGDICRELGLMDSDD